MIATAITWLVAKGLSERMARFALIGGLVIALIAALGTAKCAYDRSVIRDHEAKQEAKQAKRERKADRKLDEQKQIDERAADERQKEIDDATRNIPDQMPSARQRARVCVELRRQGIRHPSCEPA
jgi:hypothetical protein